jgi:long-subunit acyl-CoA synthetase (AMP-forming)
MPDAPAALEAIVVIDPKGLRRYDRATLHDFETVLRSARALERAAGLSTRLAAQRGDDTALMIFTSGSTGRPKAAMISYDNINAARRASRCTASSRRTRCSLTRPCATSPSRASPCSSRSPSARP